MIAILTADIINSRKSPSQEWIKPLKALLDTYGSSPADWEIYRGDEFQLAIKNPEEALLISIQIKALLKSMRFDARIAIGLGTTSYHGATISQSNGSAFERSGITFDTLKKRKINLAVSSGDTSFDTECNLLLKLCLAFMDHWLQHSATFVFTANQNPNLSQADLGTKLGINQAAVSRRLKRSHYDLLLQVEQHYRTKIKNLNL
ncbi:MULTISPECIES: SatD family protein [unclassified Flavobacterium]|uniref:SatD family protein n=1 Tax=unclassified Flavobacterium TaxID=196869 RepID=UPI00131B595C|nr:MULTISPECIES: SatD family protein [unclassified Flavobacterium]